MIPETKNGSAHWIPITPLVKQILLARIQDNKAPRNVKKHIVDTPYVFPSRFFDKHLTEPSALLEKADQESGLTIRLHDLRRTFAGEIFNKSGRDSLTTKLAMNHSSGTDDITASYMMIEPKLEALRPLFEEREKRLFKIAGVFEADETKPEEALELETA
jgi:integrase